MSHLEAQYPFSTIAVDLTPVLPGGDNGGAKVYILALIKQLAAMSPETNFILLTQSLAHEELCALEQDSSNITCKQVILSKKIKLSKFSKIAKFLFRLQHLPFTRSTIQFFYYFLLDTLKRFQTNNIVKELNADLLFCPFTAPTFSTIGIPTVSVIHDIQFKSYPHFFNEEELFQRGYTLVSACKKAHILIAVSEYARQSVLLREKINPQKILTIHTQMTGQETPTHQDEPLILKKLHLTPQNYVLYPANFWKHKNHEMLFTAFQHFVKANRTDRAIQLVCTGAPGERQQWLMTAAQRMGLESHIIFPGFLSFDNLNILLKHSAGVIFPSLYEGYGLPIIEAMAAGVPVACSNRTALPEIAGNAALLFNPTLPKELQQALETLVFDDQKRSELIQLGNIRAKELGNITAMAEQYWDAFALAKSKAATIKTTSH